MTASSRISAPRVSATLQGSADGLLALSGGSAAVIALASGGEVRFGASGRTRPPASAGVTEDAAAVTLDTLFDLASVTKVMTTTASIMRLVSAASMALDDRIAHYLPAFADGGARDAVTVRDLLLHRGGLQPWWPLYMTARDRGSALQLAATLPLAHPPRAVRHYSDLGFMLLGAAIEQVAGAPLDAAARELVFEPLGLRATTFNPSTTRPASGPANGPASGLVAAGSHGDRAEFRMIATGEPYPVPFGTDEFDGWREHLLVGEANDGNAFHAFGGVAGHAGLFSSPADLLAFATALASVEEHEDLFSPEVTAEFFAPGPDAGQSLGFRRYTLDPPVHVDSGGDSAARGATVLGHPGYTGTAFGFIPGTGTGTGTGTGMGTAFVVATNRLLGAADPLPNDAIWAHAVAAVSRELDPQHPPLVSPPASPPKEA